MPIIFGWGRQTTWNIGPVFRQHCNHCNNDEYWRLLRRTTWCTLFFIPIIPYKTEWWLLCPICQYGLELKDKQVRELQPIAEVNQLFATGEITEQEYQTRSAALNNTATTTHKNRSLPEAQIKIAEEAKTNTTYCDNCGKGILPDGRFCTSCGSNINQATV